MVELCLALVQPQYDAFPMHQGARRDAERRYVWDGFIIGWHIEAVTWNSPCTETSKQANKVGFNAQNKTDETESWKMKENKTLE